LARGSIAILPMGFCFPGIGRSGDLPPRSECAPLWRQQLLDQMKRIELTLVIGDFAQRWHLPDAASKTVTHTVAAWHTQWPAACSLRAFHQRCTAGRVAKDQQRRRPQGFADLGRSGRVVDAGEDDGAALLDRRLQTVDGFGGAVRASDGNQPIDGMGQAK
jgi:hypothetical protein